MMTFLRSNKWQILLIALLTVVFFYKVFFFGEVLSGADILVHWYSPWKSVAQEIIPGTTKPQNPEISDPVFGSIPGTFFSLEYLKHGQLPFWSALKWCGLPQYSDGTYAIFYPFNLINLIPGIPLLSVITLRTILQLFLLGLFTLLYTQKIGIRKEGSLIATVIVMFGFRTIVWLEFNSFLDAGMFYPLILYVFEDFLEHRRTRNIFLSVLLCSFIFLCHNPKPMIYFTQFLFIYICFRVIFLRNKTFAEKIFLLFHGIIYFVLSIGLAAAVASVQILPMFKAVSLTNRSIESFGPSFSKIGFLIRNSLSHQSISTFLNFVSQPLVGLFVPKFFGWPADLKLWSPLIYSESIFYIGILPVVYFIVSVLRAKNYFVRFYVCVSVVCFLLTIRCPIITAIYSGIVPGAGSGSIRLFFLASFGAAITAGFGLDYLLGQRKLKSPQFFYNLSKIFLALFLMCGVLVFLLVAFRKSFYDFIVSTRFLGVQIFFDAMKARGEEVGRMLFFGIELIWYELINLLILASSLLAGCIWAVLGTKAKIKNSALGGMAAVFIFLDLAVMGIKYNPTIPLRVMYPATETTKFLQADKDLFRVTRFGRNDVLPSGALAVFGISDADGRTMSIRPKLNMAFSNLIENGRSATSVIAPLKEVVSLDSPLLDLSNVKYVVSSAEIEKTQDASAQDVLKRNPLVWAREGVFIYKNSNYLPRAFIVHKAKVVKDEDKLKELLKDKDFKPEDIVLLSGGEEIFYEAVKSSADIEEYSDNRLRIRTNLSKPGYLILSDTFYPGWKARVDGKNAEILRANFVFRAVYLDEGEHVVEFSYVPDGFQLGAKISLIGIFTTLAIGIIAFFIDRKKDVRKT